MSVAGEVKSEADETRSADLKLVRSRANVAVAAIIVCGVIERGVDERAGGLVDDLLVACRAEDDRRAQLIVAGDEGATKERIDPRRDGPGARFGGAGGA